MVGAGKQGAFVAISPALGMVDGAPGWSSWLEAPVGVGVWIQVGIDTSPMECLDCYIVLAEANELC